MVIFVKGLCISKGIIIYRLKRVFRSVYLGFFVKIINIMNYAIIVKIVFVYNYLIDYKKNVIKVMYLDLIKIFSILVIDRNYIIWIKLKFFFLLKIIS